MHLCCPTYKRFDLLVPMIESAEKGTLQPESYIILDNSAGQLIPYLEKFAPHIIAHDKVNILVAGYNMGVSRGWNVLLEYVQTTYGNDAWCLVVNDDIIFHENTIALFQNTLTNQITNDTYSNYQLSDSRALWQRYKYPILCGAIDGGLNAFSMFVTNPKILKETLGLFDATLWPGYFDDNDMHYRMKLQGIDLYRVSNAKADHSEGGSATLKSYNQDEENQHHHQFRRNQEYFIRKWGGEPGKEKYLFPFNNEDVMRHMLELYQRYGF